MKIGVFIDYDNLIDSQKTSGILNLVTKALMLTPLHLAPPRGGCDIRVYGGWYEGTVMTQLAQAVTVAIQSEFPAIIRLPRNGDVPLQLGATAELAVSLLEEPGHHLFNTYRKGKPTNVRIQGPGMTGCTDSACLLPNVRKLLKTGTCPLPACTIAAVDLLYRHEQKIVDTMLSCDLVYATTLRYDQLIVISGDDDFLPPLRTALLRGVKVVRCHPRPNCPRARFPAAGPQLVEIDL